METKLIKYPTGLYSLYESTQTMFNMPPSIPLEQIHEAWKPEEVVSRETDQQTPFHSRFYHFFKEHQIQSAYENLIREVVQPYIGEEIVYQAIPSFRIQFPKNKAVGEKHKDSDYSHSTNEINFWLPLTDTKRTNTIWIEGEPHIVKYGEILVFDGANKEHENKVSEEVTTRVSLDFRVIPKSKFKPSDKTSINTKLPMTIGGYWAEL